MAAAYSLATPRANAGESMVGSEQGCVNMSPMELARMNYTFSHRRVDPGGTERSGWSSTSSFRAVVFMDSSSLSYSPREGSSPIPTTIT